MKGWLAALFLTFSLQACGACVDATDQLNAMETGRLALIGPGDRSVVLTARVADDPGERAAGFQHICPGAIDETNIYFVFDRVRLPAFHMRNVQAPLDIAFIDPAGTIVDIQRMEPYVKGSTEQKHYSPPVPVAAALETRAGYFTEQNITAGDWKIEPRKE